MQALLYCTRLPVALYGTTVVLEALLYCTVLHSTACCRHYCIPYTNICLAAPIKQSRQRDLYFCT